VSIITSKRIKKYEKRVKNGLKKSITIHALIIKQGLWRIAFGLQLALIFNPNCFEKICNYGKKLIPFLAIFLNTRLYLPPSMQSPNPPTFNLPLSLFFQILPLSLLPSILKLIFSFRVTSYLGTTFILENYITSQ